MYSGSAAVSIMMQRDSLNVVYQNIHEPPQQAVNTQNDQQLCMNLQDQVAGAVLVARINRTDAVCTFAHQFIFGTDRHQYLELSSNDNFSPVTFAYHVKKLVDTFR